MKVLIVDDSSAMRMMVLRTLRQAGFGDHDFVQADDGTTALETIEAEAPDVVLCDWNMPTMNGIDVLKTLNEKEHKPMPKFGFVTTEATGEMRKVAGDAGAAFMIAKPFTAESFQASLTEFLG
ncbi:MAG: response regulator [Pseudomonadota bacterium]